MDALDVISSEILPENSPEVASIASEPGDESDLYIGETVEVVSTDESIICLDEDEVTEEGICDDTASDDLFPDLMPDHVESPSKEDDDDDFTIVYEKRVPPAEVEVLESYTSPYILPRKTVKRSRIAESLNQSVIYDSDQGVAISPNAALDDSVYVVERIVNTTQSANQSNALNTLCQAVLDSTEKKKRKIECGVCFDGPDEIENRGSSVVSTVCGHIFCKDCITTSVKSLKHCPQCRKKLTMKQFHNLYV